MKFESAKDKITEFCFKRNLYIYICGLFAVFLALYTQSFNFRLGDQFFYANDIETGRAIRWVEAGHLFYRPSGWFIYKLFLIFGYTGCAVTVLQLESAFLGALGVSCLFYVVYGLVKNVKAALFSALVLAFSHSYWAYSGNGSSYIPATSFIIIAFIFMFKLQGLAKTQKKSFPYVLAISLLSAISAHFWLPMVLCIPSLTFGVILIPQCMAYRKRFSLAFIYLFGFLLSLSVPLFLGLIFINECRSIGDILIAIKSTSHGSPLKLSVLNFLRIFYGSANAFVAIPDMGATVRGLVTGDFYLKGTGFVPELCKFLAVWMVCLLIIAHLVLKFRSFERKIKTVVLILVVWILPFFCFGIIWHGHGADLERMLPALPAAILIASIAISHTNLLRRYSKHLKIILAAIFLIFTYWNFSGFFVPQRNYANDKDWKMAKAIEQKITPSDLVLLWGQDMLDLSKFAFYYDGLHCRNLNMDIVLNGSAGWDERVAKWIQDCRTDGGKVYIHYRLIIEKDVPESRWSEKEYPHPTRQELQTFFSQYRKSFAWIIEGEVFWEIVE